MSWLLTGLKAEARSTVKRFISGHAYRRFGGFMEIKGRHEFVCLPHVSSLLLLVNKFQLFLF
jgi:hypothetical protein